MRLGLDPPLLCLLPLTFAAVRLDPLAAHPFARHEKGFDEALQPLLDSLLLVIGPDGSMSCVAPSRDCGLE